MIMDEYFQWANGLALMGWIFLIIGLFLPPRINRRFGLTVPVLISCFYLAMVLVHFSSSDGAYDSLANVMLLFQKKEMVLAGWAHYLAFDLFVGWCIANDARQLAITRFLVIPSLLLTFLFGPVGLLLHLIVRTSMHLTRVRPALALD